MLKPKIYWKITSKDTKIEKKAAEIKKYLKLIILYTFNKYIINNIIKNLKNNIDFSNLVK